ncbi:hypothetical protein [Actinotalea sp. Marseille-Q4924]|uniref:hypothetical protein n=1 Tax=Actinotalea sp. Marseille-Q4924 TaxID=2866571 RepID=UPI001CE4674C|nr:hypothetical protein [Actinotalea sp. Marseille-Q4924]
MLRPKILPTIALTAGLVVTGAGAATAHECYIAPRSDKGDAGADRSANWSTLHLEELYRTAHLFLGTAPLTDAQVAEALVLTEARGIPTSVTLFERFTIPRSAAELERMSAKSSDGKGVDHFFAAYGDAIIGIVFEVLAEDAPA